MKILVTGGFGYIGSVLIDYLKRKGHDIRVFAKSIPDYVLEGSYDVCVGDVLVKEDVRKALKSMDAVVHLAGIPQKKCRENPLLASQVNGIGTMNVLDGAKKAGARKFIYASTFHVYGNPQGKITEETPTMPLDDYALSKLAGEDYCRQFNDGIKCRILRLSNSYGFSLNSNNDLVINDLCRQCVKEKKIILKSKGIQKRDFVALNDVCGAILVALSAETEEIVFNVGGNNSISIMQAAELIVKAYYELYNEKITLGVVENPIDEKSSDFEFDISRIMKLGYKPSAKMKKEIKKILEAYSGGTLG